MTRFKLYFVLIPFFTFVSSVFSQSFTFEWARYLGGTSTDVGNHLAVDNNGNVYTAGRFLGTADFLPGTGTFNMTSAGDFDMFLQKMNADGEFQWAIRIGGTGYDEFTRIALAPNGDICAVGVFNGTVDFDPSTGVEELTSAGGQDIAVMRFNSDGELIWVHSIGSAEAEFSGACSVDSQGRILISGNYRSTCSFNHGAGVESSVSVGLQDIFVMCFEANGNLSWLKTIGSTLNEQALSSVFDSDGNTVISGIFRESVDFNPGSGVELLTSAGETDVFVLKLNSNGDFVWAKSFGGPSFESVYKITADADNNILISGYFYPGADLDPGPGVVSFPVDGDDDCFIQKLNPGGDLIWVKQIGGSVLENTYDIYCDNDNDVYVVGDFFDTVDFDPGPGTFNLTSSGNNDIFCFKLKSNGDFEWAYKVGATFSQAAYAIHVDNDKNVYTTGTFSNNVDFDPTSAISLSGLPGEFDVFVLKIGQSCLFPVFNEINLSSPQVCNGESVTLQVEGDLNGAAIWSLRLNSCNGSVQETSVDGQFEVNPSQTTTYFINASGGCLPVGDVSACGSTEVTILPTLSFFQSFTNCRNTDFLLPSGTLLENMQEDFTETFTLTSSNGCDSVITFSVDVEPHFVTIELRGDTLNISPYIPKGYSYSILDCNNNYAVVNALEIGSFIGDFILPGPGSYAASVESGFCSDTTACEFILKTQITKVVESIIYPNPFRDIITLEHIESGTESIELYSSTGQLMLREQVVSDKMQFTGFETYAPGLYFMRLIGKETNVSKAIIKL